MYVTLNMFPPVNLLLLWVEMTLELSMHGGPLAVLSKLHFRNEEVIWRVRGIWGCGAQAGKFRGIGRYFHWVSQIPLGLVSLPPFWSVHWLSDRKWVFRRWSQVFTLGSSGICTSAQCREIHLGRGKTVLKSTFFCVFLFFQFTGGKGGWELAS